MADQKFDAFLTYTSGDRRLVRRIQRFLESFRPPKQPRHLSVYLDQTDMRGGSLPGNLADALAESGALVVCWSDKAAASSWVAHEIAEYRRLGRDGRIAIVHVGGAGPTIKHDALSGIEPIEHDLRHGWIGPFLRPRAKLELLRLLAFLTNVEMRVLRNWARRRMARSVLLLCAVLLIPPAFILSRQLPSWDAVPLSYEDLPIEAVACDVVNGKLWAASQYDAAGERSGTRAYVQVFADVLTAPDRERPGQYYDELRRRALPPSMVRPAVWRRIDAVLKANRIDVPRGPIGHRADPLVAVPRADRFVYIQPIVRDAPSPEEIADQARDRLPIPETNGTVVVVYEEGSMPRVTTVEGFSPPVWRDRTADNKRRTLPSRGMSVIWQDSGDIWIGAAGERDIVGGLWHSADRGRSWRRIDDFSSVTSLELRQTPGGSETLVVAEQSFKRLSGTEFVGGSSRVVERASNDTWVPTSAPPYGTNSEIEMCGTLPDGTRYVRVDNQIYREGSRPIYASIFGRSRTATP